MFQYPQADRRGCNPGARGDQASAPAVSVSTSGSKGVQRSESLFPATDVEFQYPQADRRGCNKFSFMIHLAFLVCFSIHKRIEGGATSPPHLAAILSLDVSVSTSGSKGVQPRYRIVRYRAVQSVSVSTSGSKGVQRQARTP